MQDQIDLIRSTLAALGVPVVDTSAEANGDIVVTTAADAYDRTIQIPSALGGLGYEMMDARIDAVSRYSVRRLPLLSSATIVAFLKTARRVIVRGDWLVVDPIVPVLLDEISDPARLADPMRDRMRAIRHVVRIARMAAEAVSSGLMDAPDGDVALLTDPVSHDAGAAALGRAA